MEFVPMIAMAALVLKLIDFAGYAVNRDTNGVRTQLVAWGAGIIATLIYAHSDWARGFSFGGLSLHQMNTWSQIIVGVQFASVASAGHDLRKVFGNHNTVAVPTLLPPRSTPPIPPPIPSPDTTVG